MQRLTCWLFGCEAVWSVTWEHGCPRCGCAPDAFHFGVYWRIRNFFRFRRWAYQKPFRRCIDCGRRWLPCRNDAEHLPF